jgi:hypothetical protein
LIVTSCGGGHPVPTDAAAVVRGHAISRSELRSYVDYALSFYSWAYGADPGASNPHCSTTSRDPGCRRLVSQALRRLIEETVVEQYASGHHIALSTADRRDARRQAATLLAQDTTAAQLLAGHKITRSFVLVLLDREALVRKVEAAVSRKQSAAGPALHVREFEIPRLVGADDARTYQQAVDLATDGKPVPPSAMVRTSWIARFHLSPELASALSVISPGQFVGPFTHSTYYLDVLLIGRGVHHYGKPARLALQASVFGEWLAAAVRQARPRCYDVSGHDAACPSPQH